MKIDIQAIHFRAQNKLLDTVRQRIEKLETFYHSILSVEVFLRLEKSNERANKQAEIKLHLPGHELFTRSMQLRSRLLLRKQLKHSDVNFESTNPG